MPTKFLTSSNANGGRFAGLSDALKMQSGGSSSRLATHQAKMGRASDVPSTSVPAPAKANTSAPAKTSAPVRKISDQQYAENARSLAVLMQPNAKGKGDAIMAMLNADRGLTARQAIARLDTLPFNKGLSPSDTDKTTGGGGQKPQSASSADVWDRAYASVFGTGNANIDAMTDRNIAKLFPGQAK